MTQLLDVQHATWDEAVAEMHRFHSDWNEEEDGVFIDGRHSWSAAEYESARGESRS